MIRVPLGELTDFTCRLFEAAGLEPDKARATAEGLIEADMIGHATHGLALAPRYLKQLVDGNMAREGTYEVVSDRGACVVWRGRMLPGLWLVREALALGMDRARTYGVCTIVIGESQHNGALAAVLREPAEAGFIAQISCSSPAVATVAPHGGTKGLFTPNPIAMGIPTSGDPILIDISSTITTSNMSMAMSKAGETYDHDWLLDAEGRPSNDPAVVPKGGSLMLLGGMEKGHKGFGMALMVEALSQGLSGIGRTTGPKGMNLSIFVQVIDPDAFAGREALIAEMDHLACEARANPPRPGTDAVRMPGDGAAARRREAKRDGVPLSGRIAEALRSSANDLGVIAPF